MADKTGIEWADATWNPIVGCSIVSAGCTNCYAMKHAARLLDRPSSHYSGTTADTKNGGVWTGKVEMAPDHILKQPLHWTRPRRIFVNSMGDLFHESVPDDWIDRVFAVMALAQQHTFMILTKRPERMREYATKKIAAAACWLAIEQIALQWGMDPRGKDNHGFDWLAHHAMLPNVWLGVSIEDQDSADARIPPLLMTPAALRFVSAEPLLGPVALTKVKTHKDEDDFQHLIDALSGRWMKYKGNPVWRALETGKEGTTIIGPPQERKPTLDWVICGGESGPGARPMHPDWPRWLRDQCLHAEVPFFFKQWGEWIPWEWEHPPYLKSQNGQAKDRHELPENIMDDPPGWDSGMSYIAEDEAHAVFQKVGKKKSGRALDGRTWDEFPGAPMTKGAKP